MAPKKLEHYALLCDRMHMEDFYSIKEFAKKLKVHPDTIRRAIKSGRIHAFRAGSSSRGIYRIPSSEIHRMAEVDLQGTLKQMVDRTISLKN